MQSRERGGGPCAVAAAPTAALSAVPRALVGSGTLAVLRALFGSGALAPRLASRPVVDGSTDFRHPASPRRAHASALGRDCSGRAGPHIRCASAVTNAARLQMVPAQVSDIPPAHMKHLASIRRIKMRPWSLKLHARPLGNAVWLPAVLEAVSAAVLEAVSAVAADCGRRRGSADGHSHRNLVDRRPPAV
jgi:hypothetical protein